MLGMYGNAARSRKASPWESNRAPMAAAPSAPAAASAPGARGGPAARHVSAVEPPRAASFLVGADPRSLHAASLVCHVTRQRDKSIQQRLSTPADMPSTLQGGRRVESLDYSQSVWGLLLLPVVLLRLKEVKWRRCF